MKKIISILLVLMLAVTCLTPSAFADVKYDSISLEMQFQDGSYGNYHYFDDNESQKFKLLIAYWKGDDIVKKKYVSSEKELAIFEKGKDTTDATLKYGGNNYFELKGKKPKKETTYYIEYTGDHADKLTNGQVSVIVQSSALKNSLKNLKFRSISSTPKSNGNMITWKRSATKVSPDYIGIYRSKKKNSGYKLVGIAKGNEKSYLDDSGISKGNTYYYKVKAFSIFSEGKKYSKYSGTTKCNAKVSCKAVTLKSANRKMLQSYDQKLVSDASIYGLPENISWIDNPKNKKEYKNNMLYAFLIGDYEMNVAFPKDTKYEELEEIAYEMQGMMYQTSCTYPDLAGWYMNDHLKGYSQYEISYNKYGYPVIRIYMPAVDPETVVKERKAVIDEATKYRKSLYASGVLKETMSDMEKLQTYYRVLDCYADVPESDDNYQVYYDTSYGYFIKKNCNCGGRASGITTLFHLEGIMCAGVHCTDHITTMLRIDGKDYIVDIGNRVPLKTVEEALSYKGYGEFEIETIDNARKAFGLLK